jgi:hypothetical protein
LPARGLAEIETAGSEHIGQLRTVSDHWLGESVDLLAVDLDQLSGCMTRYDDRLSLIELVSDACGPAQSSAPGHPVIWYFGRGVIDRADHLTRYVPAVQARPSVPKHLPIGRRMFDRPERSAGGYQTPLEALAKGVEALGQLVRSLRRRPWGQ